MLTIKQLFRFVSVDPVNLSPKAKLLAVASGFISIFLAAWFTRILGFDAAYPIIVASMGASAVIVFILPHSPLAQPWALVGGQMVSAVIGVASAQLIGDVAMASGVAVAGSIFFMLLLRCLHPPGAATALAPMMGGHAIADLGYHFILVPVAINVLIMLIMAILINRWLLKHSYPIVSKSISHKTTNIAPAQHAGISDGDLKQALKNMDMFVDVSLEDLSQLLSDAERNSFKRLKGNFCCRDIMVSKVLTVEYGTEVEDAWKIMHREQLKAMPVIDKARRVIGIITWNDFFKFLTLNEQQSFQETFRHFIRRTPETSTNKPESVGHIMTSRVTVLPETTHIAELIPLMSKRGLRQIPIVNAENRLVGMVYQANLIAALYDEQMAAVVNPG